jgi:hypothetical protein
MQTKGPNTQRAQRFRQGKMKRPSGENKKKQIEEGFI